ncbi:MAG: carbohydrate kinase family protein [Bacteroidetes bacterium]|nr:MAG: carbohydrate kinase family protein [Bacteroidota bacterium]
MTEKFDILAIGELNVDLILNDIQQQPELGKEIIARSLEVILGSSTAIFASNISIMGASVAFLGKIGKDSFADTVLNSLRDKGVNTDFILQTSEFKTGASIALNYDQDRYMVTYPGAMEHLTIDDISNQALEKAAHLHFSSPFLQPGIRNDLATLFQRAKDLGLSTSLDTQWDPQEKWDLDIKAILPFVDVFLPNAGELIAMTGVNDITSAAEKFIDLCETLVVKCGEDGAMLFSENQKILGKPFSNDQVVDAIGAGDSFNAGFIFKYVRGQPLNECLEFANLMGALNTTGVGGTGAFLDHSILKEIALEKFGVAL